MFGRQESTISGTVSNAGVVCLSRREDATVAVQVIFDTCLSSSCERAGDATCSAMVDGDRLVVTSELAILTAGVPGNVCTTDCGRAEVDCGVLDPVASRLRVVHGSDQSEPITFPLAVDTQLFTKSNGGCDFGG